MGCSYSTPEPLPPKPLGLPGASPTGHRHGHGHASTPTAAARLRHNRARIIPDTPLTSPDNPLSAEFEELAYDELTVSNASTVGDKYCTTLSDLTSGETNSAGGDDTEDFPLTPLSQREPLSDASEHDDRCPES